MKNKDLLNVAFLTEGLIIQLLQKMKTEQCVAPALLDEAIRRIQDKEYLTQIKK